MTVGTVGAVATVLAAVLASGVSAQQPGLTPRDRMTNEYSGVINVTSVEGDSRESIIAYVDHGTVLCNVSFTDEEGTRGKSGPGMLHITLGIKPGPDDAVPPNSHLYKFEVACPNAMYTPPHEARWSHVFDSYKRIGGDVRLNATGQPVLPDTLQNSFNEKTDEGSLTMSWLLCRNCQPPPHP